MCCRAKGDRSALRSARVSPTGPEPLRARLVTIGGELPAPPASAVQVPSRIAAAGTLAYPGYHLRTYI